MKKISCILVLLFIFGCKKSTDAISTEQDLSHLQFSENILDYRITPKDKFDKSGLMFSDQGAWFAYSFPDSTANRFGFSGPFLMTQQNGVWSNALLTGLKLTTNRLHTNLFNFETNLKHQVSNSSSIEQLFDNNSIQLKQELVFLSKHSTIQKFTISNTSNSTKDINLSIEGGLNKELGITFLKGKNHIKLVSKKSSAVGYIKTPKEFNSINVKDPEYYYACVSALKLEANETKTFVISHTFIFPEYSWEKERKLIESIDFDSVLHARQLEKNKQLKSLINNRKSQFQDDIYAELLAKAQLTLQNNWRSPAGEIKHEGLFPSYHYKWFNGFWSWDSWKHAVGLSYYDLKLAKEQVKLMFDFQNEDGFVADCVFRDTLIERHNYRDTKPPLSAWAVAKIYKKDKDLEFVKYMYPKLKKYHEWWYTKRDHDQDGLCEYGSTDGSLVAAKWESGMDNAIRFDDSKIIKNSEGAYSLNQESVDLNAYLYAEKLYLAELSKALNNTDDLIFLEEASQLKNAIQTQFYDSEDSWFYDTTLEGNTFIKGEGSEGWTALWANVATQEQAETVKNKMMNSEKFFTKVPFQTMSADHEKFDPLKGYWRGPNWLDQAYFGVKGLRNYGFNNEANKATIQILEGAEGLLGKGKAIRENYHPLTGEGLHAQNFSWSAAHIIMLLLKD